MGGGQGTVLKKASGHSTFIMVDLFKMALDRVTKVKTALSQPRQRILFKFVRVLCLLFGCHRNQTFFCGIS